MKRRSFLLALAAGLALAAERGRAAAAPAQAAPPLSPHGAASAARGRGDRPRIREARARNTGGFRRPRRPPITCIRAPCRLPRRRRPRRRW